MHEFINAVLENTHTHTHTHTHTNKALNDCGFIYWFILSVLDFGLFFLYVGYLLKKAAINLTKNLLQQWTFLNLKRYFNLQYTAI